MSSGASHLEDGGLLSQSSSPGKMGHSSHKAHLRLSVQAEVFIRGGGDKKMKGGVEKFSERRRARSIPIRQVMVWRTSSWLSHSGFPSSQLHIILAPRVKASKSPRAGMPEGQSLYLLKLVPRIPIQTHC